MANSTAVCADFLCIPSTAAAACEAPRAYALNLSAEQLELCARADYILVDLSCSGSGIVTRLDSIIDDAIGETEAAHASRLRRLSGFQLRLVLHALSFERVRRVVYSVFGVPRGERVRRARCTAPLRVRVRLGRSLHAGPPHRPITCALSKPSARAGTGTSAAARQKEASEQPGREHLEYCSGDQQLRARALASHARYTLLRSGRTPASSLPCRFLLPTRLPCISPHQWILCRLLRASDTYYFLIVFLSSFSKILS